MKYIIGALVLLGIESCLIGVYLLGAGRENGGWGVIGSIVCWGLTTVIYLAWVPV